MASIKISQLNKTTTVTSDDFFPIVDSGSLTTFYTPVDSLRTFMASSGAVPSASWASASISSKTTITASHYTKVRGFFRFPSLVAEEAVEVCKAYNGLQGKTLLVSLNVQGYHSVNPKIYLKLYFGLKRNSFHFLISLSFV